MDDSHANTAPKITIYQNDDHVIGIVEQALQRGSLTSGTIRSTSGENQHTNREGGLDTGGSLDAGVPGLGKAAAKLGVNGTRASGHETTGEREVQDEVRYSQAYQLDAATQALQSGGLLHTLDGAKSADKLRIGDFVEFRATFRPNQLIALLDVLTPALVSEIARYSVKDQARGNFDAVMKGREGDYQERLKAFSQLTEDKASSAAALWEGITRALRADFRSDATREYYGAVGDGDDAITAVTVCDTEHFITADPDRLLDGSFTVLGKAASKPVEDRPVLQQNKLAARIDPDTLDGIFKNMSNAARKPVEGNVGGDVASALDMGFDARVRGMSLNVLPIAIYL